MNVIGIDYGFGNTGYTVAGITKDEIIPVEMNVIQTKPSHKKQKTYAEDDNINRIKYIVNNLCNIISFWNVKIIMMEQFTTNVKNTNASRKLFGVVGSIAAMSEILDIPSFTVTPTQIKKAICNKNSASKKEIIETINSQYDVLDHIPKAKGKHEHCYDGLAVIITTLKEHNMIRLMVK